MLTPKHFLFNELSTNIWNSFGQKLEQEKINSIRYNSKTHSTLKEDKFIPLYAEDLHSLITRVGWFVTHIDKHFTFE